MFGTTKAEHLLAWLIWYHIKMFFTRNDYFDYYLNAYQILMFPCAVYTETITPIIFKSKFVSAIWTHVVLIHYRPPRFLQQRIFHSTETAVLHASIQSAWFRGSVHRLVLLSFSPLTRFAQKGLSSSVPPAGQLSEYTGFRCCSQCRWPGSWSRPP